MTRTILASLALLGIVACGRAKQEIAGDDAGGRNLERAPSASGGTLSDRPASSTSTTRTLGTGARIEATMAQPITSRTNKAGETVTATVAADAKDRNGRVVVPAGSAVELLITQLEPAKNKSQADGTLIFQVTAATVRGQRYPMSAEVTSVPHTLKGRGVTAGEVEKVGVGTAIGAVAGRVIGGNATGAVVGGAVGAGGGAVVAVETASRDVVVRAGAPVVITLTGPLTVSTQ
jgi:hypothetical protein